MLNGMSFLKSATIRTPILIAECGNNHEGSLDTAIELLHRAKEAGADLVKFQAGTATGFARFPEQIPFYAKYDLGYTGYEKLVQLGDCIGIPVFFSVWSELYRDFMNLPYKKIAARQCNQLTVDKWQGPKTFISIPTDLKLRDIKITEGIPMNCVSKYPAHDGFLVRLKMISDWYNLPVGYSDHCLGIGECIRAVKLFGAKAIEKHFTLAHDFGQLRDHALSATPKEFKQLAEAIK